MAATDTFEWTVEAAVDVADRTEEAYTGTAECTVLAADDEAD